MDAMDDDDHDDDDILPSGMQMHGMNSHIGSSHGGYSMNYRADTKQLMDMDAVGMRETEIREQDRYLPIANIARIMKKFLPGNAKIAKDAKESIQECVSEFISFITSEASEKCQQEKRKTLNGDDILWAMGTLGFEKYIEPLKQYLNKYRESVKGDRPDKKPMIRKEGPISNMSNPMSSSNVSMHSTYKPEGHMMSPTLAMGSPYPHSLHSIPVSDSQIITPMNYQRSLDEAGSFLIQHLNNSEIDMYKEALGELSPEQTPTNATKLESALTSESEAMETQTSETISSSEANTTKEESTTSTDAT